MLFSRTAVHGVHALCHLSRERTGKPPSSSGLAAVLGIPRERAARVLQSLNSARLACSIRGRRGGYMLRKQLDEIAGVDVPGLLNPLEDDEHLRPKDRKRGAARIVVSGV